METTLIDELVNDFFAVFGNTAKQAPCLDSLHSICLPAVVIIKKEGLHEIVYSLQSFIAPRKALFASGSLTDFQEKETNASTQIVGNMAQRLSSYQKTGCFNGERFQQTGTKIFQLVNTVKGWKISALVWEDM